jgi:hypothetical protein
MPRMSRRSTLRPKSAMPLAPTWGPSDPGAFAHQYEQSLLRPDEADERQSFLAQELADRDGQLIALRRAHRRGRAAGPWVATVTALVAQFPEAEPSDIVKKCRALAEGDDDDIFAFYARRKVEGVCGPRCPRGYHFHVNNRRGTDRTVTLERLLRTIRALRRTASRPAR